MDLLTLDNLVTLLLLVMLQAVLGFDNLLYISLESQKVEKDKQAYVRKVGIVVAIFLRIGLLFLLTTLIDTFQESLFEFETHFISGHFNVHSLIVLIGGIFIIYTAVKEIWHMMSLKDHEESHKEKKSVGTIIFWIVIMNLIFSFDSILSAMALSDNFIVMTIAIVIGGILMIWLSDTISNFLQKNRMYEVLGLFVLFIVGIMLLSEGGHIAHLAFFGNPITPMSKTTFYFILFILVIIDVVQGRYQKKLMSQQDKEE